MNKKFMNRAIALIMAIITVTLIILPSQNAVYAAKEKVKDEKASLFEKAGAGFITMCGLGLYTLTGIAAGEPMSIDKLIFNQYGNTTLSFFEGDSTLTKTLDNGQVVPVENSYISGYIKMTINNFFTFFTKIAVMAYMVILVYMGIRILLGIGAEGKSRYKELFLYWIQGIAILFLFPYVIKYTIFINNAFVKFINDNKERLLNVGDMVTHPNTSSGGISNLGEITKALDTVGTYLQSSDDYMAVLYRLELQDGWLIYAFAWFILVMQMIGLFVVYIKRVITTIFLIAIFPLVTISYAIDKIGDGKSQAFSNWYKEFALNVFLQSFHAIVYVIGMALIMRIGTPKDNWLLIIIILTFISKGDEMLKSIFHMKSGGGDTVKGLGKTIMATKGAATLASKAKSSVSNMVGPNSHLGNAISNVSDMRSQMINKAQSRENIAALQMESAQDSAEQAGSTSAYTPGQGAPTNPQPAPEEKPLTALQQAAETALDENASEEERSDAILQIANALNSENEDERNAALQEIAENIGYDDTMKLMAAAGVVMAAGTLPVDLEENIQVILKILKENKNLKGRRVPRTAEEEERLRKANKAVNIRRASAKIKKTSKANKRDRYAKRRTDVAGTPGAKKLANEKYNGVFTIAPSTERMRKARAANAQSKARAEYMKNRTFRQKVRDGVVAGGAGVVTGARGAVGAARYQINKAKARKGIMGYERRALLDTRRLVKLQKSEEKLRGRGITSGKEYDQIVNEIKRLQAPTGNIYKLNAKRADYARRGIYFTTGGATRRYLNTINKVENTKKEFAKTFREVKTNRKLNKAADKKLERAKALMQKEKLTAVEQKELEAIKGFVEERKTTRSVIFGKYGGNGKTRAQDQFRWAYRRYEINQLKRSIHDGKSRVRAERAGNRSVLRNARIQETKAYATIAKAEVKSSVRQLQDRKYGRVSDYNVNTAKEVQEANNLLKSRGIILRPPKVSNAVQSGISKFDNIIDRSGEKAKAKEGYATTRVQAYNAYQRVKKNRGQAELELAKARNDIKKARTPGERELAKKREEEALSKLNTATSDQAKIYLGIKTSRQRLKSSGVRFVGFRNMGNSIEREIEQDIKDRIADARKGERAEENKIRILINSKNAKREEKLAPKSSVMAEMLRERNRDAEAASALRDSYAKENEALLNVARNLGISTSGGATPSFSEKVSNLAYSASTIPSSMVEYARGTGPAASSFASDTYSIVSSGIMAGARAAQEAPSKIAGAIMNAPSAARDRFDATKESLGRLSDDIMALAAKKEEAAKEKRTLTGFITPSGESSNIANRGVPEPDKPKSVMDASVLFVNSGDTTYHGADELVVYESSFGHGKSKKSATEVISEYVNDAKELLKKSAESDTTKTSSTDTTKSRGETSEIDDTSKSTDDTIFNKELFLLSSSICALNQAEAGFYTAEELIAHINNVKRIQGEVFLDARKNEAVEAIVSRLSVDLSDFESDLRVKVINDPTLLEPDSKSSKKIMESSIKYVQNMSPDDLFLSNLVYNQEDLAEGHIPTPKFGGVYGITAKEADPEDLKVQNAFEYSLREKRRNEQIAAEESNIRRANKAIGSDLVSLAKNTVGVVADAKIGIPLSIAAGAIATGAGSGSNDGTMGLLTGVTGYSLVSGSYKNVSSKVENAVNKGSKEIQSIADKARSRLKETGAAKKPTSNSSKKS